MYGNSIQHSMRRMSRIRFGPTMKRPKNTDTTPQRKGRGNMASLAPKQNEQQSPQGSERRGPDQWGLENFLSKYSWSSQVVVLGTFGWKVGRLAVVCGSWNRSPTHLDWECIRTDGETLQVTPSHSKSLPQTSLPGDGLLYHLLVSLQCALKTPTK